MLQRIGTNKMATQVLRLYPPIAINERLCVQTTALPTGGGEDGTAPIVVEKGTPVAYSVYLMHRRKDLYGSDAESFRPERWDPAVDNEVDLKNIGWGFLPFNGGPRTCLGQEFAMLELQYTLVRMIQKFGSFEYDPMRPMPTVGQEGQEVTLDLRCADGCYVRAIA
jgi:cytochrome P450